MGGILGRGGGRARGKAGDGAAAWRWRIGLWVPVLLELMAASFTRTTRNIIDNAKAEA